ncbi:hypothetical protein PA08_1078 [Cutibacterium modestum P08]|nr:hypothetical protein PA08_1078 [Cutibacterium modestum P08]
MTPWVRIAVGEVTTTIMHPVQILHQVQKVHSVHTLSRFR